MAAAPSQVDASFTTEFSTLVRELRTDVYFCDPQDLQSKGPDSALVRFDGVWDTGATVSVISEKVVRRLGLNPINTTVTQTVNGPRKSGVYLVSMGLPNRMVLPAVQVVDGNILGTDALIGMDIICRGDFAITHHSGKTKLTFSMPPAYSAQSCRLFHRKVADRSTFKLPPVPVKVAGSGAGRSDAAFTDLTFR